MKKIIFLSSLCLSAYGLAEGQHADHKDHKGDPMMIKCKSFCPKAKSTHDMHECMKKTIEQKKNDAAFQKSECVASVKEHEKNEKNHEH